MGPGESSSGGGEEALQVEGRSVGAPAHALPPTRALLCAAQTAVRREEAWRSPRPEAAATWARPWGPGGGSYTQEPCLSLGRSWGGVQQEAAV